MLHPTLSRYGLDQSVRVPRVRAVSAALLAVPELGLHRDHAVALRSRQAGSLGRGRHRLAGAQRPRSAPAFPGRYRALGVSTKVQADGGVTDWGESLALVNELRREIARLSQATARLQASRAGHGPAPPKPAGSATSGSPTR